MTSSPHPLRDNDVISRVETVVATDMDGEVIMMSVESGRYFHLDDIATEVWRHLDQPRRVEEIVGQLREVYDVPVETCRSDAFTLISKLLDLNVLRIVQT